MKVPYLKKKPEIKSCHNIAWEDNYSWIHQKNILEVLRDKTKLDPEVKKYLEEKGNAPRIKERMMTQYWQLNNAPLETATYWKEAESWIRQK